jgi:dephospho-CoA kinase
MPLEEKKKVATYVIENDGDREALSLAVDRILEALAD